MNKLSAFFLGVFVSLIITSATSAVLGTMHDNENGKFLLDTNNNITVRVISTQ